MPDENEPNTLAVEGLGDAILAGGLTKDVVQEVHYVEPKAPFWADAENPFKAIADHFTAEIARLEALIAGKKKG